VVGDRFGDKDRFALLGADPVNLAALIGRGVVQFLVAIRGVYDVVSADGHCHAGVGDPVAQDHPAGAVPIHLGVQHAVSESPAAPRIVVTHRGPFAAQLVEVLLVDDLG